MPHATISDVSDTSSWTINDGFQPRQQISRYLFRVTTPPESLEETSTVSVQSSAVSSPDEEVRNILDRGYAEAGILLNHHLRWYPKGRALSSNLVTWTSDLHWALSLAFREYTDRGAESTMESIRILMLDTKGIEHRFVDALELVKFLSPFYKHDDYGKWKLGDLIPLREGQKGRWEEADYLSQGHLDVRERCVETTLQAIVEAGLLQDGFYPELGERSHGGEDLGKKVARLRGLDSRTRDTSPTDVQTAIKIGECFGVSHPDPEMWTIYVAVMVLGFASRYPQDDETIFQGLRSLMEACDIHQLAPDVLKISASCSLPGEIKRAASLAGRLHAHYSPEPSANGNLDDLLQGISSISLSHDNESGGEE